MALAKSASILFFKLVPEDLVSEEAMAIKELAKVSVKFLRVLRSSWTTPVSPSAAKLDFLLTMAFRASSRSGTMLLTAVMTFLESADEAWEVAWVSLLACLRSLSRVCSVCWTIMGD
jgi:hypothetical protein